MMKRFSLLLLAGLAGPALAAGEVARQDPNGGGACPRQGAEAVTDDEAETASARAAKGEARRSERSDKLMPAPARMRWQSLLPGMLR